MNETMNHLLRRPQGLYMQGMGGLKRSVGAMLRIAVFEHAGRSQLLSGLVLRHGGLSREDALRAVGSFSKPGEHTSHGSQQAAAARTRSRTSGAAAS